LRSRAPGAIWPNRRVGLRLNYVSGARILAQIGTRLSVELFGESRRQQMENESPLDNLARQLFGDSINHYARGNEELEQHALDVCRPATIALSLREEFSALALTSRMDQELRTLLSNGLCKQGNAQELLFDTYRPLATFAAKIDMAYCIGFTTKKMYDALTLCRRIRNMYAHFEDPHAVRQTDKYQTYRRQLLELDADWTADQIQRLSALGDPSNAPDDNHVAAIMVGVCDCLGSAAFFSVNATQLPQSNVIPCFYGFDDTPELREVNGRTGFFGPPNANGENAA